MKPLHYDAICVMLLERFGEPIGDREAAPTSTKKKDMGNRGFGSDDLDECGEMMPMEIDEVDGDELSRAEDIITQTADADMSAGEMLELLRQSGISQGVARNVVLSVRGSLDEQDLDEKTQPKKKGKPRAPEWVRKAIKKGTAPNEPLHTALRGVARRSGKIAY